MFPQISRCFDCLKMDVNNCVKNITTGEDGSILTNNKYFDEKIKSLRTHGVDQNTKNLWFYEMKNLGFNYRISDMQCALGISQLKKLKTFFYL